MCHSHKTYFREIQKRTILAKLFFNPEHEPWIQLQRTLRVWRQYHWSYIQRHSNNSTWKYSRATRRIVTGRSPTSFTYFSPAPLILPRSSSPYAFYSVKGRSSTGTVFVRVNGRPSTADQVVRCLTSSTAAGLTSDTVPLRQPGLYLVFVFTKWKVIYIFWKIRTSGEECSES
jgi:hypothetical protein